MPGVRKIAVGLVVCGLALAAAACGPAPRPTATVRSMFGAYLNSVHVVHDEFGGSATTADRLANFAAYFTVTDLEGFLFSAYDCGQAPGSGTAGGFAGQLGCPPSRPVVRAAAGATVYERNVLVRHPGGRLELMPLYVVVRRAGGRVLVDARGTRYPGGLTDFREHNGLLTADDQVLVPANVTDTAGGGRLVVVSGHTPPSRTWLVTVLVVAGVLVVGLVVVAVSVLVVRRRRRPIRPSGDGT